MLQRSLLWLKAAAALGRMWLLSRQPHIEETLPDELTAGPWVAIATQRPLQPGEPVYGTPAYKAVRPGERYWIFVDEGDYWVYAVAGAEPMAALRDFYANPDGARLVDSAVRSLPGFRAPIAS